MIPKINRIIPKPISRELRNSLKPYSKVKSDINTKDINPNSISTSPTINNTDSIDFFIYKLIDLFIY